MNQVKNQQTRSETEMLFFGRIMASISHEINNVMSIVGQVGGLMEDLVAMEERGGEVGLEKWRKQTERIVAQAARGRDIIKNMNRFAHSIDHPRKTFDVVDETVNMLKVLERLITNRGTSVSFHLACENSAWTGAPFLYRLLIFSLIDSFLSSDGAPGPLVVSCREVDASIEIKIEGGELEQGWEDSEAWTSAVEASQRLGASLVKETNLSGRNTFKIILNEGSDPQ